MSRDILHGVRVLIIEDDPDIAAGVEDGLRQAGFAVDTAADITSADLMWQVNEYDAVVADRMVPDGDVLDYVAQRRATDDPTPVLFLTARDAVEDRVEGFEIGGDDYLIKPFALDELIVRVRALCRRRDSGRPQTLVVGGLEINRAWAEVSRDGVLLPLTAKERCIAMYLAERADEVVSRSDLMEHCWDDAHDPMSNVIDVHIGSLRRKLGSSNPVRTVRGAGFMLETRPDA